MGEPTMMLLDEPLAGINPALARTIGHHLLALRDAGVTMLVIEHDLGLVERLCDPVIVMAQGKVLSEGSMSDLRRNKEVVSAYLTG
jgi:ABC-type branched-subunit amino acid transport system ATPase component